MQKLAEPKTQRVLFHFSPDTDDIKAHLSHISEFKQACAKAALDESSSDDEFQKYVPLDRFGFVLSQNQTPRRLSIAERKKVVSREKKWMQMLSSWPTFETKSADKVRKRARKGIPQSLRATAWLHMAGAHESLHEKRQNAPGLYAKLRRHCSPVLTELQIRKDITRTFPNHGLFSLYREQYEAKVDTMFIDLNLNFFFFSLCHCLYFLPCLHCRPSRVGRPSPSWALTFWLSSAPTTQGRAHVEALSSLCHHHYRPGTRTTNLTLRNFLVSLVLMQLLL
jgi:hypothetical protein